MYPSPFLVGFDGWEHRLLRDGVDIIEETGSNMSLRFANSGEVTSFLEAL